MKTLKLTILPVILSTIWIAINEFARNQLILSDYWTEHYQKLSLVFPTDSINNAIWAISSLVFAISIFLIAENFLFGKQISSLGLRVLF